MRHRVSSRSGAGSDQAYANSSIPHSDCLSVRPIGQSKVVKPSTREKPGKKMALPLPIKYLLATVRFLVKVALATVCWALQPVMVGRRRPPVRGKGEYAKPSEEWLRWHFLAPGDA